MSEIEKPTSEEFEAALVQIGVPKVKAFQLAVEEEKLRIDTAAATEAAQPIVERMQKEHRQAMELGR